MTQYLKNNGVTIALSFILMGLPLLFPAKEVFWLVMPLIVIVWISKTYRDQSRLSESDNANDELNDERLNRAIDTYLTSMSACVEQETSRFQVELGQLKTMVADAVVTMSDSFNSLHTLTAGQSTVVYSLVRDLDGAADGIGGMSFAHFAQETDDVLRFFIDHILQVSKQSMEMVAVINDVGAHMAHVEKLLADVQKIADQTNLLALNAAIEAARAGEAGRGFAVVADEVRNLSKHSDKFSEEIKAVVNASKNNIHDAQTMIEVMASKDMNVAISSKASIDKMMQEISAINGKISENITEVSKLTGKIEASVGNAVRGLQFEDMARQLIEYLQINVEHFQAMADEIHIGMGTFKVGDREAWERELDQGAGRIRDMRRQWDNCSNKSVAQSSMDEGGVDLF